jgi:hypothetical protein
VAVKFRVRYAHVDPFLVIKRMIRNPNYGGDPCTVPGTCIIPVIERKIKPKFFKALRKDVSINGFRNPILLYNTPEGLLLSFGGSRLRVAKDLRMDVPAIIVDYVDLAESEFTFNSDPVTPGNYFKFFRDEPVLFKFTDIGVDTHYALERNRRRYYDPAGMAWTEGIEDDDFVAEEFPWL